MSVDLVDILLSFLPILLTAVFVFLDAKKIREQNYDIGSPVVWLIGVLALALLIFPAYLIKRKRLLTLHAPDPSEVQLLIPRSVGWVIFVAILIWLLFVPFIKTLSSGIGSSLSSSWSYETTVDPMSKNVIHTSTSIVTPEGSGAENSEVEFTVQCEKENDPSKLMLEIATHSRDGAVADPAVDIVGAITLRLNQSVFPLEREGTVYSNSTKWNLQSLNLVALNDAVDGVLLRDGRLKQILAQELVRENPAYLNFLNSIWDSELVFAASTSVGDITAIASLDDPNVRRTVQACGFEYGQAPPRKAGKSPVIDGGNVNRETADADPTEDAAQAAPAEEAAQAPLSQGTEESSGSFEDSPEFMEAVESCREAQVQQMEEELGRSADSDVINAISERCILKFKDASNQ